MAVKKITADGPGHALLELDNDPGTDQLELSVLDIHRNEYLGPSTPAKVTWLRQPHYFMASRVEGAGGFAFRVGPDICNYVPAETMVEIESRDGTIATQEPIVWEGIVVALDKDGVIQRDLSGKQPPPAEDNRRELPRKPDEKIEPVTPLTTTEVADRKSVV